MCSECKKKITEEAMTNPQPPMSEWDKKIRVILQKNDAGIIDEIQRGETFDTEITVKALLKLISQTQQQTREEVVGEIQKMKIEMIGVDCETMSIELHNRKLDNLIQKLSK